MKRIAIVGCSGGGKSTIARKLGDITGLPVFHLDAELWRPGWVMTPKDEELVIQQRLASGERWIIDGNYGGTMEMRFARADTVIFMDFPRWRCLWRCLARAGRYWGRTRPDMGPNCPEKFDLEFLRWIWTFNHKQRPLVVERIERCAKHCRVVRLRTPAEVARFQALISLQQASASDALQTG
jgi:adenylate kinase family enzyme